MATLQRVDSSPHLATPAAAAAAAASPQDSVSQVAIPTLLSQYHSSTDALTKRIDELSSTQSDVLKIRIHAFLAALDSCNTKLPDAEDLTAFNKLPEDLKALQNDVNASWKIFDNDVITDSTGKIILNKLQRYLASYNTIVNTMIPVWNEIFALTKSLHEHEAHKLPEETYPDIQLRLAIPQDLIQRRTTLFDQRRQALLDRRASLVEKWERVAKELCSVEVELYNYLNRYHTDFVNEAKSDTEQAPTLDKDCVKRFSDMRAVYSEMTGVTIVRVNELCNTEWPFIGHEISDSEHRMRVLHETIRSKRVTFTKTLEKEDAVKQLQIHAEGLNKCVQEYLKSQSRIEEKLAKLKGWLTPRMGLTLTDKQMSHIALQIGMSQAQLTERNRLANAQLAKYSTSYKNLTTSWDGLKNLYIGAYMELRYFEDTLKRGSPSYRRTFNLRWTFSTPTKPEECTIDLTTLLGANPTLTQTTQSVNDKV